MKSFNLKSDNSKSTDKITEQSLREEEIIKEEPDAAIDETAVPFKTASPGGTLHSKLFDTIVDAFEYLEGDGKDEPSFSIHEVSRLAINLHSLMVDNNASTICGFKHKDTWSKEDLSIFIRDLFETLLDFLDGNEDSVPNQSEIIQ